MRWKWISRLYALFTCYDFIENISILFFNFLNKINVKNSASKQIKTVFSFLNMYIVCLWLFILFIINIWIWFTIYALYNLYFMMWASVVVHRRIVHYDYDPNVAECVFPQCCTTLHFHQIQIMCAQWEMEKATHKHWQTCLTFALTDQSKLHSSPPPPIPVHVRLANCLFQNCAICTRTPHTHANTQQPHAHTCMRVKCWWYDVQKPHFGKRVRPRSAVCVCLWISSSAGVWVLWFQMCIELEWPYSGKYWIKC